MPNRILETDLNLEKPEDVVESVEYLRLDCLTEKCGGEVSKFVNNTLTIEKFL